MTLNKAIRFYETGTPEVMRYEDIDVGEPAAGQVRRRLRPDLLPQRGDLFYGRGQGQAVPAVSGSPAPRRRLVRRRDRGDPQFPRHRLPALPAVLLSKAIQITSRLSRTSPKRRRRFNRTRRFASTA